MQAELPRESAPQNKEPAGEPPAVDVVVADMDGDGDLDRVSVVWGKNPLLLWMNPEKQPESEKGETPRAGSISLGTQDHYARVTVGDVDGDGDLDIVAATFDTRRIRWWLKEKDKLEFTEGTLPVRCLSSSPAVEGKEGPQPVKPTPEGPQHCPRPCVAIEEGKDRGAIRLSSIALEDMDPATKGLELAVSSFVPNTERSTLSPLHVYTFKDGRFEPRWQQCTRGVAHVTFVDMDADGHRDLVTSRYQLGLPDVSSPCKAPPGLGAGKPLQWGEWWDGKAVKEKAPGLKPTAMCVTFKDQRIAKSNPALAVVDFDAFGVPAARQFALALSAHHCPEPECWNEAAGGMVAVIDKNGKEEWTSQGPESGKKHPHGGVLVPSVVRFSRGGDEGLKLVVGYWWGKPQPRDDEDEKVSAEDRDCLRAKECPGPFLWTDMKDSASFTERSYRPLQVTPYALTTTDVTQQSRDCPVVKGIATLPHADVLDVVQVDGKSDGFHWTRGSRDVVVHSGLKEGKVRVTYRVTARRDFVVADLENGIQFLESTQLPP